MLFMNQILGFGVGNLNDANWALWDGTLDGASTLLDESGGGIYGVSCGKLTATTLLVTYFDRDVPCYYAVVLTINDTAITIGTAVIIDGGLAGSGFGSLDILDAGRAIYTYISDTSLTKAVVISISGTTVTINTIKTISATDSRSRVAKVDTDKCVVIYAGKAVVMTITGTTVNTPGAELTFDGAEGVAVVTTAVLDITHIVVAYRGGTTGFGRAITLLVGATTLTAPSAAVQFEAGATTSVTAVAMSASLAIVAYADQGDFYKLTACVLNISGTTTTAQTPVVMDSSNDSAISQIGNGICKINETHVMVNYSRAAAGSYAIVGILTGNILTNGTRVLIDSNTSIEHHANIMIDADRVLCVYGETPPSLDYISAKVLKT